MIFVSQQPRISVPENLPIWDFLFESEYSPLRRSKANNLAGFTNAVTKERVRYDELKTYATSLSTALVRRYGLRAGETVALFSPNTVWYPVAMLGTIRVGGVISGASPAYNVEEMTYALKTAQAKILMTTAASLAVAVPAAQNAGIPRKHIFLLEGDVPGYTTIKELLEIGDESGITGQVLPFQIPRGKTNKDVCGFLSFSSGTTGLPKAVMISHQNVMAQCLQVEQVTSPEHKKVLAVLPLFHITGLVHQMHLPVLRNAEVYMLPAFSMESMLSTVVEYQISELLLVPPILIQVKIIDPDTGRELGYDEPGEILARGPQVVMGYLDNEKATRETFDEEGWLHTGDVGYMDREGFITITDRIKEMIKVKGIAVAPAELEDLLLGHPMVEDVAVSGISDNYTGERPKAYVVLKPNFRLKKDACTLVTLARELIDYVQENKVRHKWIVEVEILDEIPKSASGKILRRTLRKLENEKDGQDRLIARRQEVRSRL
ncbi:hypothetical protein N7474_010300 [Penicillium riverlandense]|uniref:uncharacterized protein n=1 Tax=Penicillium riverlandense TaxID=1903569 RepID=UPI002548C86F|nr:uncharacterized protein N7474_010300 [Penicillium riverlandense]KAJ5806708.1 hypothetical protein N7474_010300 [Penicillium riverlandense]